MKIILLENIKKIGKIGSTVNVKDGYAKNFLLRKKKAIRATPENIKFFTEKEKIIKENYIKEKNNAIEDSINLKNETLCHITQATTEGKLYGAISNKQILKYLNELKILSKNVSIENANKIKETGLFRIKIILHPEIESTVKIVIAKNKNEARNILTNSKIIDNNEYRK